MLMTFLLYLWNAAFYIEPITYNDEMFQSGLVSFLTAKARLRMEAA